MPPSRRNHDDHLSFLAQLYRGTSRTLRTFWVICLALAMTGGLLYIVRFLVRPSDRVLQVVTVAVEVAAGILVLLGILVLIRDTSRDLGLSPFAWARDWRDRRLARGSAGATDLREQIDRALGEINHLQREMAELTDRNTPLPLFMKEAIEKLQLVLERGTRTEQEFQDIRYQVQQLRAVVEVVVRSTPQIAEHEPIEELPPKPVLQLPGPTPHYEIVDIFYATDRGRGSDDSPHDFYKNERGGRLSLGTCQVSIPEGHKTAKLEAPRILTFEFHEDPAKHVVLLSVHEQEPEPFFGGVAERVASSQRKDAFVFVHGYNVSFKDAARRTAQLAYDLKFQGAPILYSWPSKAKASSYVADEATVRVSAKFVRTFLQDLVAKSGAQRIHLIAHSMGNRAVAYALEQLGRTAAVPMMFQQLVLTAPDIDTEEFNELAAAITPTAARTTLYVNPHDLALELSRRLHEHPRAGEEILIAPSVDTIDASAVDTSLLGHSSYGDNRTVLTDIDQLIRTGAPPDDRTAVERRANGAGTYFFIRP